MASRIEVLASYVQSGESVVDIGTDHAKLPIYLYDKGITKSVVASDVNEGPLNIARENIGDRDIKLVLSNGLNNIEQHYNVYVIAGMGGILISKIIESDIDKFKGAKRIILQPMQQIPDLREFLFSNGFKVLDEHISYENKRFFEIIVVSYGAQEKYDFRLFKNTPKGKFKEYKDYLIKKNESILSKIPKNNYKYDEIDDIINELKKLD